MGFIGTVPQCTQPRMRSIKGADYPMIEPYFLQSNDMPMQLWWAANGPTDPLIIYIE